MSKKANLTKWCMLNVAEGTKLYRKGKDEHEAITRSIVSMELEVLDGKNKIVTAGLMEAEKYLRQKDGKPVKRPEGWDYWGFLQKDENGKNVWKSVHSVYNATENEVLIERRSKNEVTES